MADFATTPVNPNFDPSAYYDQLKGLVDANNEFDQSVMEFNAQEAQKNRDFQERMSSTAHQREVQDLLAAGLNPVLSAKLGGASTPTGSSASGSNTSSQVLSNVFGTIVNSATNMASKLLERQNVLDQVLGSIQVGAGYNAAAVRAAEIAQASALGVAQINQDTQLSSTQMNNLTSKENTLTSAKSQEKINKAAQENSWDINAYNQALTDMRYWTQPNNMYQAAAQSGQVFLGKDSAYSYAKNQRDSVLSKHTNSGSTKKSLPDKPYLIQSYLK